MSQRTPPHRELHRRWSRRHRLPRRRSAAIATQLELYSILSRTDKKTETKRETWTAEARREIFGNGGGLATGLA